MLRNLLLAAALLAGACSVIVDPDSEPMLCDCDPLEPAYSVCQEDPEVAWVCDRGRCRELRENDPSRCIKE